MLFWLKLWDKVVFNKEKVVPNRSKKLDEKKKQQQNNFKNKWQPQNIEVSIK